VNRAAEQDDHCQYQQHVNEATHCVRSHQPHKPKNQE
jgi:hypothetical protein